jgi:hypothetical protein
MLVLVEATAFVNGLAITGGVQDNFTYLGTLPILDDNKGS